MTRRLPSGQKDRRGLQGEIARRKHVLLSRPRRIEHVLGLLRPRRDREGPGGVRRKRQTHALAETNGRRSVRAADENGIPRAGSLAGLREEDGLPVPGEVEDGGPVEPRELPLLLLAGAAPGDPDADDVVRHQRPAVAGDVLKRQALRNAGDEARVAGESDGLQGAVAADLRRREPDLSPVGRPGQPVLGGERSRQSPLLSGTVHDGDRSAVVAAERVIQKSDEAAVRRNARVADPTHASRRGPCRPDTRGDCAGSGRARRESPSPPATNPPTARSAGAPAARRRPTRRPRPACHFG